MAQNPTSKGIGTGSAQVFDYSRIDRAMANMFDTIGKKDAAAALKADEQQAKEEKAIAELSGKLGDYDVNKLRTVDVDSAIKMTNDSLKKYNGHWKDILNGDPKWSNMYNEDIGNIKKFMAGSINSKEQFKKLYESADSIDSGFSDERKKAIKEYYLKPGATYEEAVELGLTSQDTIVGNPLSRIDDAFKESGDELYYFVNKAYTAADGSSSTRREKVWKEDSEAIPAFKSTIASSTRLMSDMNIKYPNMSFDDQVKAFYDEYKSSRQLDTKESSYRAAQIKDNSGSGGAGDISSTYFKVGDKEGFTIANPKKALTPITVTIKATKDKPERTVKVMPSEFVRTKNGWGLRGTAISKSWSELSPKEQSLYDSKEDYYETASGDLIDIPATENVRAKTKDQYGLPTNWDEQLNKVKGNNSENTSTGGAY